MVFKSLDRERAPGRGVLIVGAGDVGQDVARVFSDLDWMGLQVVGFLDDDPEKQGKEPQGIPVLRALADAESVIRDNDVSEVTVTLPLRAHRKQANLVAKLGDLNVNIKVVPDLMPLAYFRTTLEELAGVPPVGPREPVLDASQRNVKRIFDLMISALGLAFASPLLVLTAAIIKLDSSGPVIFRQKPVGENGTTFDMYKFRTMVQDEDKLLLPVMEHDAAVGIRASNQSAMPRVTEHRSLTLLSNRFAGLPSLFTANRRTLVTPEPPASFGELETLRLRPM